MASDRFHGRYIVLEWEDESKVTSSQTYITQNQASHTLLPAELDFCAALAAFSGCKLTGVWLHFWTPLDFEPQETPYGRIADRLNLCGSAFDGSRMEVRLPGPVPELFKEDGREADLEDPSTVAVVDAALAVLANNGGSALKAIDRGKRSTVKIGRI